MSNRENYKNSDYVKSGQAKKNLHAASLIAAEKSRDRARDKLIKSIAEYDLNPKICRCGKPHEYKRRNGKYCSQTCAAIFTNSSRIYSDTRREKLKDTLKQKKEILNLRPKICKKCFIEIPKDDFSQFPKRKVCSKCTFSIRSAASKKHTQQRVKDGTHKGWAARTKEPSYPEKYFISLFENENIVDWVRELKVERWFIDFAFSDKMIALEIDGRQHEDPERKASDEIKDARLIELGWKVIRIKWYNPVNEKNKKLLYPQIESFKELLG
jgi:very-short-patch-repair endonuclease/predicted Zn-ribbon and HTH transcriptional regulator